MLHLQAFRNAFMALARKSPATAAGAARRTSYSGSPYNTRTAGGYVYVVPRGTLGQVRRTNVEMVYGPSADRTPLGCREGEGAAGPCDMT